MTDKLIFISNNVRRIQVSDKKIKSFEHLKNYGFIFLQETHSKNNNGNNELDESKG